MNSPRSTDGFTLIELLIVIAVIGILAAVLIPTLMQSRNQAQVRSLQIHSKNVQTAATAWLASGGGRTNNDAVNVWSPCLSELAVDGYGTPAAPGAASACSVVPASGGRVDAIVIGDINGTTFTFVNGSRQ